MTWGALDGVADEIRQRLDAKYQAREAAIDASRQAIRHAANAIRATHRGEVAEAERLISLASGSLGEARRVTASYPALAASGLVTDAEKEYAEACLTRAAILGEELPDPVSLGVDDAAWLGGLAETIGEQRRAALDRLRAGNLDDAERLVDQMDAIFSVLVTMDYPEGITGGLRRSTDVSRGILERTRGDVTTARLQDRLRAALEAHRGDILGE